jgi:hypothetical protein
MQKVNYFHAKGGLFRQDRGNAFESFLPDHGWNHCRGVFGCCRSGAGCAVSTGARCGTGAVGCVIGESHSVRVDKGGLS